ncbi:hypothetical protein X962_4220 [Burkholderia pseudomallei MSHR7343]|nr:hypothetical protein X962_4220 [Burkholderia pseudomallei MSHR7343]KGS80837.1 hypothetical protein X947_4015 [Burkholderia pseudomallei MSHR7334]
MIQSVHAKFGGKAKRMDVKRWLPCYRGPDKPMYLGKRSDLLADDELK